MKTETFYSNGKLLLTAEYLVLDGALALAIPTIYGQELKITPRNIPNISWKSIDVDNTVWFESNIINTSEKIEIYPKNNLNISYNGTVAKTLQNIINKAKQLNPKFLSNNIGYNVETKLNFSRHWGLGTSSTLVNNIAQWAKINPFKLLTNTFGGSGYDIVCAKSNFPITYQLNSALPDNANSIVNIAKFSPPFSKQLFFVYLNKKQNSRTSIARYRSVALKPLEAINEISNITKSMITCNTLSEFKCLLSKHEQIISNIIKLPSIKAEHFPDFNGEMKSLGAWGGDFIITASENNPTEYFKAKGYKTIISFENLIHPGAILSL